MKRNPLLALLLFRINHNKWSKIMKISLFLLFVCTFQLMSINSNAQNVTIKIASGNITIGQLIKERIKSSPFRSGILISTKINSISSSDNNFIASKAS